MSLNGTTPGTSPNLTSSQVDLGSTKLGKFTRKLRTSLSEMAWLKLGGMIKVPLIGVVTLDVQVHYPKPRSDRVNPDIPRLGKSTRG